MFVNINCIFAKNIFEIILFWNLSRKSHVKFAQGHKITESSFDNLKKTRKFPMIFQNFDKFQIEIRLNLGENITCTSNISHAFQINRFLGDDHDNWKIFLDFNWI